MESKRHLQSVFCFKVSRSDTEHFCLLYIGTCFRDTFVFRIWQKCLLILKLFWFSTLLLCVVKRCINMSFKVKTNVHFFNMKVNYKFLCILWGFKLSRRPIINRRRHLMAKHRHILQGLLEKGIKSDGKRVPKKKSIWAKKSQ